MRRLLRVMVWCLALDIAGRCLVLLGVGARAPFIFVLLLVDTAPASLLYFVLGESILVSLPDIPFLSPLGIAVVYVLPIGVLLWIRRNDRRIERLGSDSIER